ncbi:MAG: LytTR family DNA-binding domain-containing protein [Bacteroidia bacterium]|nr:LytTR family DNA-binding domain-containing protein [Bacteroidia bacterium]
MIKLIIVDDEPKAIQMLESYVEHFPMLSCQASFRNALKAFEYLSQSKIDLILLDINMPHLSGLALSKMIDPNIQLIFTTAYSEYAAESYEVHAIDYLLKPISLERFGKAISKVLKQEKQAEALESQQLLIKSGSRQYPVQISDILYLEKDGNYMSYYLAAGKVIARQSVAEALLHLPQYFVQCHKSFIVNCRKISFFEKDEISLAELKIPIGNSYRENFLLQMRAGF